VNSAEMERHESSAPPQARDAVYKYGNNSNSFITLYRDFRHFYFEINGVAGVIGYVDTRFAWIAAAEPLAPADIQLAALELFAAKAKEANKHALIMPVNQTLAMKSREAGHDVFEIGREPWLKIGEFRYKSDYLQMIPVAKQLKSRGAEVLEFTPPQLSADEHAELKQISQRWLDNQRSEPLGFLNRLDPWALMQNKKYFRLLYQGQQVAYLAAVPVPARNAWYLIDLVRDPDAPIGATELLIIEAMDILQTSGAKEVTLGMSPFVPVDEAEFALHPRTYKILKNTFENSQAFYGFKSLYTYKQKFAPQQWESLYLVALTSKLNWRMLAGIFLAVYPKGVVMTALGSVARIFRRFELAGFLNDIFADRVVLRTMPKNFIQLLARVKASIFFIFVNSLFYIITTDNSGHIRERVIENYAYSWQHLVRPGWTLFHKSLVFVMPAFLHSDPAQFTFNMVTLALFVGLLEMVIGTTFMGTFYLIGAIFGNIATTVALTPFLSVYDAIASVFGGNSDRLAEFLRSPDVGCSLGVLSCVGAIIYLSRHPKILTGIVVAVSIAAAIFTRQIIFLNHIVAAGIGYLLARRALR
jgi:membrane associated rhomboid family serine protease